jgi:hypothetical protein
MTAPCGWDDPSPELSLILTLPVCWKTSSKSLIKVFSASLAITGAAPKDRRGHWWCRIVPVTVRQVDGEGVRALCRSAFHGALLLEDEIHKPFAEIRGGMDVLGSDLDLVQVLEPEDVPTSSPAVGLGDDPTEEKTQIR